MSITNRKKNFWEHGISLRKYPPIWMNTTFSLQTVNKFLFSRWTTKDFMNLKTCFCIIFFKIIIRYWRTLHLLTVLQLLFYTLLNNLYKSETRRKINFLFIRELSKKTFNSRWETSLCFWLCSLFCPVWIGQRIKDLMMSWNGFQVEQPLWLWQLELQVLNLNRRDFVINVLNLYQETFL